MINNDINQIGVANIFWNILNIYIYSDIPNLYLIIYNNLYLLFIFYIIIYIVIYILYYYLYFILLFIFYIIIYIS